MFIELQNNYGYSELDTMLVLKDILAHEYMDKKTKRTKTKRKQKENKQLEKPTLAAQKSDIDFL